MKRRLKPPLLDRTLEALVDPPGTATVADLLRCLGMQAAITVPGEAWKVQAFSSARVAEKWGNWLILRGLVPEGRHLDVRGASLYVVHPEQAERDYRRSSGTPGAGGRP